MNININNYEAYFLDYHEGNLSLALVKELMEFLSKHPELREEFESFEPITLKDAEKINYDEKDALKRQLTGINSGNFDVYAIEYLEGTLPAEMQKELKAFVAQNPSYQKDLELYIKTKLAPDTSLTFDDKSSLKRSNKKIAVYYYWSAAASVAIIIGAYFLLNRNITPVGNTIVKHIQIKDSAVVVKQTVKSVDTNFVAPKAIPHTPANNAVKNNVVVINVAHKIQHNKKEIAPINSNKDSAAIVVNKDRKDKQVEPIKRKIPIPTYPENDSLALNATTPDTTIAVPLIKRYIIDTVQQEFATVETPKKKRSKFLIALATLTCKGLHTITGQHIELEKKFDSDTTNIVAYQLDLGNKKYEFPVKE